MTVQATTETARGPARSYRGRPSYPVPVWNGILEHRREIGGAIWTFLWCLDGVTVEKNGVGLVRGGAPVKVERIAKEVGVDDRTIQRELARLENRPGKLQRATGQRYIRCRRTPYGLVIEVLNSKKFGIWKERKRYDTSVTPQGTGPDTSVTSDTTHLSDTKKTQQETQQNELLPAEKKNLLKPGNTIWELLGIPPCGTPEFRAAMELAWSSRNRHSPSRTIAEALNAFEAIHGDGCFRRSAPFFRALEKVRASEKAVEPKSAKWDPLAVTASEIPEWQVPSR